MYPIYLTRHIEIVLRDPSGRMRAERADDLGVADVDVGMMVGSFGRLGDGRDEVDSGQKTSKLECLRDYVRAPAPSWKSSQLALYRNVG